MSVKLHHYLEDSARQWPDRIAVQELDGSCIRYRDLDRLSDRMRSRLIECGVRPGDRVGFWMRKSTDAVATVFGILKAGAAYVPLDPTAPAARNNYILADCGVAVVVIENRFVPLLAKDAFAPGHWPKILTIGGVGGGAYLHAMLDEAEHCADEETWASPDNQRDDLAFVLYTSGSTGKPKGVQLTHLNALSFVEWSSETFDLRPTDRFSSHAPFHFDLSVFDIFSTCKHGGALVLIDEETGKKPVELSQVIADQKITIWYSAPSVLSLLVQFDAPARYDHSSLRLVLFAGEVFPIIHLRSLVKRWSQPRFFNLYGPTETNVCTFYEIPKPVPDERTEPMPIGKVCSHLQGAVINDDGQRVDPGMEGELCIRGPAVTRGYWNLAEQSRNCFVDVLGKEYYRTGDIVREETDGNLRYLGRKDRMIKKRGFRVELGEIEVCLYCHPNVQEAAVVAVADDALGMRVHAHIVSKGGKHLSLIEMKTFCSEHIPVYMIPDRFSFHPALPKTSTDKVDYQTLKSWCGS